MTRVAALDRPPIDLAAALASAFFGSVVGAAAALGFLAGRITLRRSAP